MTLLSPYDGSPLARAAVRRAAEFGAFREEEVVVLTVVPEDAAFAEDRGWVDERAEYDPEAVEERLESEVADLAPEATFRAERPDPSESLSSSTPDDILRTIREVARELEATVLFVGSDNADRLAVPAESIGSHLTDDPEYDVYIARTAG
jgi:nucleotide-binding universal stress UspA family protein